MFKEYVRFCLTKCVDALLDITYNKNIFIRAYIINDILLKQIYILILIYKNIPEVILRNLKALKEYNPKVDRNIVNILRVHKIHDRREKMQTLHSNSGTGT